MSSIKRKVFYSFHFDRDVFRVQMVRNMGIIEGDEPVQANKWEEIKRKPSGVESWIDANLKGKTCLVVLIGTETASRPWVQYEIKRAWELGLAVVGVRIHGLDSMGKGTCASGPNPFDKVTLKRPNGLTYTPKVHNPFFLDPYASIKSNLSSWIEAAITDRK